MVELSTRNREVRGDGGNHHKKLGLRELRVRVNWQSLIRQVRVPMWWLISPIRGLLNPVRYVVLMISNSRSYLPCRSYLYPPALSFSSTTLPSSQEHKVKSSLSISPCHHYELRLSAAYTEYSILRVRHTLSTAYSEYSILRVQHTPSIVYTESSIHLRLSVIHSFSLFWVDPWT